MLDRIKLLQELQTVADTLFVDNNQAVLLAQKVWHEIARDDGFKERISRLTLPWSMPSWDDTLDDVVPITQAPASYTIFGVDGSQIYPDRHHGVSCFLINIGTVLFAYNSDSKSRVTFSSRPYVKTGDLFDGAVSTDLVNALRQELELQAGLATDTPEHTMVLFDGSLIFWHLEQKQSELRDHFLPLYIAILEQYHVAQKVMASYISSPKSRELMNLVKIKLADYDVNNGEKYEVVNCLTDKVLFADLNVGERSIIFSNGSPISSYYPPALHPHFFYLNTGTEIGRVEIPAWVAQKCELVDHVAAIIMDQASKGHGYPIVLSEAHEQAVVKGPDRDFFYHLLAKTALDQDRFFRLSSKSFSKRNVPV
jgi:hypothetical protein